MKAYRRRRGTISLILNLDARWSGMVNFKFRRIYPRRKIPVPTDSLCSSYSWTIIGFESQSDHPSEWKGDIFYILYSSITNKMQRYTMVFITINALHVSGGSSAHHQELKTVYTASGMCQACLLLPLAVAASKPGTYQMLCIQFWVPDDGRRNRLKRVQHL